MSFVTRGALLALVIGLGGCGDETPSQHIGTPDGPYRLALAVTPPVPAVGQTTTLEFTLTHGAGRTPVGDPQIVHERALHTFIVARDFSSFAHLHHEDFAPLTDADRARGRFRFPYAFPRAGDYRIVSEFVHRERAFSRRFDLRVGDGGTEPVAPADTARSRDVGAFTARLATSPAHPVAGHEAELVIELTRDGMPVRDLALWLGAEAHVAIWREDGEGFGHTHSYTAAMARMMASMQQHRMDAGHSAAMMLEMMAQPATLEYPGPRVPVRHTFPTPGRYRLFFQLAPGGAPLVVPFVLDVVADDGQADTRMESIVRVTETAG